MSTPEQPEKRKYQYVQAERTGDGQLLAKGTLKKGIKIGADVHKTFVLREAFMGDVFAAQTLVPGGESLQFDAAIWTRTLVSLGTFEGPFQLGMFDKMVQADYAILKAAQLEIDVAGEAE